MTRPICNSKPCRAGRGETIRKGEKMKIEIPKSKKLWLTIFTLLIPIANAAFGWEIDVQVILGMFGVSGAYSIGQGVADIGKGKAEVEKK